MCHFLFLHAIIISGSDQLLGAGVHNCPCLKMNCNLHVYDGRGPHARPCVCVWMRGWVCASHHYAAPRSFEFLTPHLSASLQHTEPGEPSAVYTLPLLLLAPSLFISLAHSSCSSILPPSLLRPPSSFLRQRLSVSRTLALSHFAAFLSHKPSSISPQNSFVFAAVEFKLALIQPLRQTFRVSFNLWDQTKTQTGREEDGEMKSSSLFFSFTETLPLS